MNPDDTILALRRENNILRALLPRLGAPCPYCGLREMSKCKRGFPGCPYADDLLGDLEPPRRKKRSSKWVPARLQNPSQT